MVHNESIMNDTRKLIETGRDIHRALARRDRLAAHMAYGFSAGAAALTGFGIHLAESDMSDGVFVASLSGITTLAGLNLARHARNMYRRDSQLAEELDRLLELDEENENDSHD